MKHILETERLYLCEVDPERDFDRWAEILADADTMRYLGGKTMDRALAWRNMATVIGHQQIRGYSFMSVIEKATGNWVGRVGPWAPEGWPSPEIGWTLHPDSYGHGFATEAAKACVDYVFGTLKWKKVIHIIVDGNTPSMAVAERIGSPRTGELDGIPGITDEHCWIYGQDRP
jgi:RimJ/RimL family protein N-acetyltransferase